MNGDKILKQLIFIVTLALVLFFFFQIKDVLLPWVLFLVILWVINLIPVESDRVKELKFKFIVGFTIILLLYIFITFSDIFIAFLIALTLAYILDPMVDSLEALKLPRTLSIIILLSFFSGIIILFLLLIVPRLSKDFSNFKQNIPEYYQTFEQKASPYLKKYIPRAEKYLTAFLEDEKKDSGQPVNYPDSEPESPPNTSLTPQQFKQVLPYLRSLITALLSILNSITRFLVGLFAYVIIPVLLFYLLRDIDELKSWVKGSIPYRFRDRVVIFIKELNNSIGNYIRGLILQSVLVGICVWLGLAIFKVNYALLFGLLGAIFYIVPYVGAVFWVVPSFFVALAQYGFLKSLLIVVGLNLVIYNVITDLILTPLIMGKSMKLHPVIIILSLLFFGKILGFLGVIIAIPLAGVLQIIFKYIYQYYKDSKYFKKVEGVDEKV